LRDRRSASFGDPLAIRRRDDQADDCLSVFPDHFKRGGNIGIVRDDNDLIDIAGNCVVVSVQG
jgi:hypothetical protein